MWRRIGLAVAVVLLMAPRAEAQPQQARRTWPTADVSGFIGYLGDIRNDLGDERNDDANHRFQGSVSGSFYWTEHVRSDVEFSATNEGDSYAYIRNPVPAQPGRYQIFERWFFSDRRVSVGQSWQFGTNDWAHPSVGAGIEMTWERLRRDRPFQGFDLPTATTVVEKNFEVRPFVQTGVKSYVSTRTFVRTDARVSFGDHLVDVSLRIGVGVDF
jgi:hypothetical protein